MIVLNYTWHCEHWCNLPPIRINSINFVLTTGAVPWCRLEAPDKVGVLLVSHSHFPPFYRFDRPMIDPTYTFNQSDLPKLNLNIDRGTNFTAWCTQWDSYCFLSGLVDQDMAKQFKALTSCLSRETLAIVHDLGLSEAQMKKPPAIIEAMQRYVDGHIKETMECHNFHHRTQQQGESFDNYLISLRELAKTCRFCSDACVQKCIKDQIIEGLQDRDTVEDLLQESELTLATTVTKCRSKEAAKKNRSQMAAQEQETEMVAAVRNPQSGAQQRKYHTYPGCGGAQHKVATFIAQHMIESVHTATR